MWLSDGFVRQYFSTNTFIVNREHNNIGEEETTLVLRHEIGGTSARLCAVYKTIYFYPFIFYLTKKFATRFPRASGTEEQQMWSR